MKKSIGKIVMYVIILFGLYSLQSVYALTEIESDAYIVDKNGYIYDVLAGTTIKDFKNEAKLDKQEAIYFNGTMQEEEQIVKTGMIVKRESGKEYIISVKGDISGDGKVTETDLLQLKRGMIGLQPIETFEKYAIDIDNNEKITGTDLLQLKRFRVGLIDSIIYVRDIIINGDFSVDISDENNIELWAKVLPGTANAKVTWKSSDPNIVDLSVDGGVIARKNGKAQIIATTNNRSATCEVEVYTTPTNIVLNTSKAEFDMTKDEPRTFQLAATIEPPTANTKTKISYESNNTVVATVDATGKITAQDAGKAMITATTENGKTATVEVTVTKELPIKDFSVSLADGYADYNYIKDDTIYLFYQNQSSKKLDNGKTKKPSTLQLVVTADNGTDLKDKVTYQSNDTSRFTVSETGILTSTAKPTTAYTTTVRSTKGVLTISYGEITKTFTVSVSCSSNVVSVSCDNGGWQTGTTNKGTGHFQRCITCYQCHRFHTIRTGEDVSTSQMADKPIHCSLCGGWIKL